MRVLIADDHPVTRDGLRAALSLTGDLEVVGEAATGEEAVRQARRLAPDLVFMDVRMPGMGGMAAAAEIRRAIPRTKVIVFTVVESGEVLAQAVRAGVSGYLLKDAGPDELVRAARLAVEGQVVVDPAVTRALMDAAGAAGDAAPLSPRETEILERVALGATTEQIGRELSISPHTVKTHLERIFAKLGATDRAQAVAIAFRRGLVR